ncbi:MAG: SRPBCC family protein [Sphingomonadales bacterium]
MGKTILKGIAGLFVAFCVGMTVVAIWRAVMQTSGDAVTSLTINRDPTEIYQVVTDPALFPDWSGWRRRDRQAVFAVHGSESRPTTCWTGKTIGKGCFTRGPFDPASREVLFALSPAVVKDGKPEPGPMTLERYHEGDGMGRWHVTVEPAARGGALVTLTFEEPEHQGFVAKVLALLSHGEEERRAADMLAALRAHLRKKADAA